jgi:hypothetical protein
MKLTYVHSLTHSLHLPPLALCGLPVSSVCLLHGLLVFLCPPAL